MRKLFAVALLAALPFAANAADNAMSYTYVEGGWNQVEINDGWLGDPKADGAYLRGAFAIADQVHLFAGYATVSDSERFGGIRAKTTLNQPEFGIGYHQGFTGRLDFTADLAWTRIELEEKISGSGALGVDGRYKEHVNAGRATIGLRGKPSARTELWVKGGWIDGSDLDGSFVGQLGGQVKLTGTWGIVGEVEVIEDVNQYRVGVRASF